MKLLSAFSPDPSLGIELCEWLHVHWKISAWLYRLRLLSVIPRSGWLLQSQMKDTSGVGKEDWLVFGEGDAIGSEADVYGFEGTVAQQNVTGWAIAVSGSYCIGYGTLTDLTACRQVLIVCLSRKDSVEVTKRGHRRARKRKRCDHAIYLSICCCCVTRKSRSTLLFEFMDKTRVLRHHAA